MPRVRLRPGDLIELRNQLLFVCVRRIDPMPAYPADVPVRFHPFGLPDVDGLVGESPLAWELRRQIAFVARRADHVLILGSSGTGKELVARALPSGSEP